MRNTSGAKKKEYCGYNRMMITKIKYGNIIFFLNLGPLSRTPLCDYFSMDNTFEKRFKNTCGAKKKNTVVTTG